MERIIGTTKMLAAIAAIGLLGNVAQAQPCVKVKGYVNAPEEIDEPVRISVLDPQGQLVWQKVKHHPGMKFKLPAGSVYAVTFEQAGSLTKTVQIDTRNAVRPYTKKQTRPVNFEVIMEPIDRQEVRYAGPVGKIGFSERTGRMGVDYDYSMERVAEARSTQAKTF